MIGLIGKPWAIPCDPPHSFDCWALVRHVRREEFGLDTPSVVERSERRPQHRKLISEPPEGWVVLERPVKGCVARLGREHVGVYIGDTQIIHCAAKIGVCIHREWELMVDKVEYLEWQK